jgi:hypothetical protein
MAILCWAAKNSLRGTVMYRKICRIGIRVSRKITLQMISWKKWEGELEGNRMKELGETGG